ncbi:hypothetical protein ACFY9N_00820 [Microbacterium sp. NPDC008134]|uniref:hypothetical protein n=1 Tax=Microbacterium sp. NPDC008134 TaxID=3364183 RepID=UPI0036E61EBB
MGAVYERYGIPIGDPQSRESVAAAQGICPFVGTNCKKKAKGGVCSVTPTGLGTPVIICPNRLYERQFRFLREIAFEAIVSNQPDIFDLARDGLPVLHKGPEVATAARKIGKVAVGAFGANLGGELRLPKASVDGASYSVDFVLTAITPEGELLAIVPVEVQTIDTTNSYASSVSAHELNGSVSPSNFGLNWENVSKRILPQLITKGLMLQGERLCTRGMYFVTPKAVFDRIAARLGGLEAQRAIPHQPGAITFLRYDYGESNGAIPRPLERVGNLTVSTSDMSLAFISPRNLPPAGAYESKLREKLKLPAVD